MVQTHYSGSAEWSEVLELADSLVAYLEVEIVAERLVSCLGNSLQI